MGFYHGSKVKGLHTLKPYISNHGERLVYLTKRRNNALVYLSNAVEKYHRDNGISYDGDFYTWASYGFNQEGILVIEEYYPNATEETYKGVDGYIYYIDEIEDYKEQKDIPYAVVTSTPVSIRSYEYIPDVYEEMLKLEKQGEIIIRRYEAYSEEMLQRIKQMILEDYNKYKGIKKEYRVFLEAKFGDLVRV